MAVTLIPQLDKYPRIVEFVQTNSGKAVLLFWAAIGLFLLGVPHWELIVVALGLIFYSKQRVLIAAALLTLASWLLPNRIFGTHHFPFVLDTLSLRYGLSYQKLDFLFRLGACSVVV